MNNRISDLPTCPICGEKYDGYPSLSRVDNETEICPDCGLRQAMEDYFRFMKKKSYSNAEFDNFVKIAFS